MWLEPGELAVGPWSVRLDNAILRSNYLLYSRATTCDGQVQLHSIRYFARMTHHCMRAIHLIRRSRNFRCCDHQVGFEWQRADRVHREASLVQERTVFCLVAFPTAAEHHQHMHVKSLR